MGTEISFFSETELRRITTVEEIVALDHYQANIERLTEKIHALNNEASKYQGLLETLQAEFAQARGLGIKLSSEIAIVDPPIEEPPV